MCEAEHITSRVRDFYRQFPFPGVRHPDRDGLILLRRLGAHRDHSLRILDAGCGTGNTAISLASALPRAVILGLDVCPDSLDRARSLAAEKGVTNVRFREQDLARLDSSEGPFDVVLCLGVLHHTADMERVLANLRCVLAPDGELYLWVYGAHGRYRHTLNRQLLGILLEGEHRLEDRIRLARAFARDTGDGEPLRDLYGRSDGPIGWEQMVIDDAWVADQFLHVFETSMDLPGLLELLESAGLEMTEWLGVDESREKRIEPPALAAALDALPERRRQLALDLLLKPERYFVVSQTP